MKKNIILFSLLLISVLSFGQTKSILIPGTKYSMIPPEGFKLSTSFSGFQNIEKGAEIIVVDAPINYFTFRKIFTKEALKSKEMDLVSTEDLKFNNSDAILYNVNQSKNGINYLKQILVFGDKTQTTIVTGSHPEQIIDYNALIKKSLFTLKKNKGQIENPLQYVHFSIDTEGTDYELVKTLTGSLIYSENHITNGKIGIMIVSYTDDKINSDFKEFCIEKLKKLPNANNSQIRTIDKIKISDMDGYEITAEGNNNGLFYQTILLNPDKGYYSIVGDADENKENNLDVYKKVARTFKLK